MRILLTLLLFLSAWKPVCSQAYRYSLRNYQAVDGLPQSQVWGIVEDNNGYLWIGTEGGGLARFDGRSFKVYTTLDGLQSNLVKSLFFDSKQNLWIVHPRGITKFDGHSFKKFQPPVPRHVPVNLRRIFEFQDTLYFASGPGKIGKIHNDSVYQWGAPVEHHDKNHYAEFITFVRKVNDNLMICLDKGSILVLRGKDRFSIPFEDSAFNLVSTFEYQKQLWLQSEQGFFVVDVENRSIQRKDLPIQHAVRYYDSINDVFWTTHGNTLYKEKLFKERTLQEVVSENIDVTMITVDSEGVTWLGTNGSGLFKYFVQDFDRFNDDKIRYVMGIYHDRQGANWVATVNQGLFKIQHGNVKSFPIPSSDKSGSMFGISETTDGKLYVSGSAGLGIYDRSNEQIEWRQLTFGDLRPRPLSLSPDNDNGLWIGTLGGGVYYLKDDQLVNYSTKSGLNSNSILALHYSSYYDKVFAGDEVSVSEIENGKVRKLYFPELENTSVLTIQPFRDSLLVFGTSGSGVIFYNPRTRSKKVLTSREGLTSDFTYFAAPDKEGFVWIGSEKGISRITLNERLEINGHVHYGYENGLAGVEANQNAFCFYDSVRLFGLVDGLYQFNDYKPVREKKFPLHLTKIEVFYGETRLDEYSKGDTGFFHIPNNLVLPHDKNHITFNYNMVNKQHPKSVKFRYFLEGFDKTWSQPSLNTETTYGNLPPGNYTFKVTSSDAEGNWSNEILSYPFVVKAPFYARMPFIITAVLAGVLLVSFILYWRVRTRMRRMLLLERVRVAEQEKMRRDIARDFHDEMGNQLTRIIHYVSLLKLNGSVSVHHDKADLYTKVEQSAKYLYTGTRDFIWSIDPSNDELRKLFLHIRDFGEKLFDEKNISFRATNNVKETVRLPYGFSRDANLIFKEAMTNAFKYSHANNVELILEQENDEIKLSFRDDGTGFEKRNCNGDACRGLRNMEDRAARIQSKIYIDTAPGKGTRVSLIFINQKAKKYGVTV